VAKDQEIATTLAVAGARTAGSRGLKRSISTLAELSIRNGLLSIAPYVCLQIRRCRQPLLSDSSKPSRLPAKTNGLLLSRVPILPLPVTLKRPGPPVWIRPAEKLPDLESNFGRAKLKLRKLPTNRMKTSGSELRISAGLPLRFCVPGLNCDPLVFQPGRRGLERLRQPRLIWFSALPMAASEEQEMWSLAFPTHRPQF
jgi:hypothetical protein